MNEKPVSKMTLAEKFSAIKALLRSIEETQGSSVWLTFTYTLIDWAEGGCRTYKPIQKAIAAFARHGG